MVCRPSHSTVGLDALYQFTDRAHRCQGNVQELMQPQGVIKAAFERRDAPAGTIKRGSGDRIAPIEDALTIILT